MRARRRIGGVFKSADRIEITDKSKLVIVSDCHRGCGDTADNLAENHNAYISALRHYYSSGFIYIELGDGDELWENRSFHPIVGVYSAVFKQLMRFHNDNRLFLIYGNHDNVKKNKKWVHENLHSYYDSRKGQPVPMFPGLAAHEGLVLKHRESGGEILLLHGHQADFFNDALAPLAKFLVRYFWRPLEAFGVKNPTSASACHNKKHVVEDILTGWVKEENVMLIAGHTHRSVFPTPEDPPYFNDGCCVHPRHITAIEIESGLITLVKWSVETRSDGVLQVRSNPVAGPEPLSAYFNVVIPTSH